MDIHAGILAATTLALVGAFLLGRSGIKSFQAGRKLTFYKLRKQRFSSGWRMLLLAIALTACGLWLPFYGEPLAYSYYPPSSTATLTPTVSMTPTISLTPTITLTPSLTETPSVTDTATLTSTPFMPPVIEAAFESNVTPDPRVFFSIQFSNESNVFPTVNPSTVFQNPVGHMYAVFTYTDMVMGTQWTALWLREGQLVHYETFAWDCEACSTGGSGYTDWNPAADEWLPGNYEVQIFAGTVWAGSGRFLVQGDAPTAIASHTLTPTRTFTPTPTFPLTPTVTQTP